MRSNSSPFSAVGPSASPHAAAFGQGARLRRSSQDVSTLWQAVRKHLVGMCSIRNPAQTKASFSVSPNGFLVGLSQTRSIAYFSTLVGWALLPWRKGERWAEQKGSSAHHTDVPGQNGTILLLHTKNAKDLPSLEPAAALKENQ